MSRVARSLHGASPTPPMNHDGGRGREPPGGVEATSKPGHSARRKQRSAMSRERIIPGVPRNWANCRLAASARGLSSSPRCGRLSVASSSEGGLSDPAQLRDASCSWKQVNQNFEENLVDRPVSQFDSNFRMDFPRATTRDRHAKSVSSSIGVCPMRGKTSALAHAHHRWWGERPPASRPRP